jgi:hypothetical protein
MEEPPPILEPKAPAPAPPHTSLAARLMNIFAVPGEVYEEVRTSVFTASNWLVPLLISALVGAVSVLIIFSQPSFLQQLREQQTKAFEDKVKSGAMTQAQADQAQQMAEKFMTPTVMKLAGAVSACLAYTVRLFWWGLVLMLLGKWFLKTPIAYLKMVEVAGLAMMITALGDIVKLLLIVNLAKMFASPSLALVINDFDATRKSHLMMGAINVFSIWFLGVLSAGLARVAGVPFFRAALLVFAYWIFQESLFILSGLGQFAL